VEDDVVSYDLEVYQQYQRLVARVEAFGEAIRQQYPGQVTCHVGCDGCCYQQFTVFPFEAYHLAQAVRTLAPEVRQRLLERLRPVPNPWRQVDESQPCVLLEHGRCSVYDGRPLICRMHGFPLSSTMIERSDGGQRDCCPLNFTQVPLAEIAPQAVYNLDLVNQTLVAINHLFVRACGQPDQRVTIRQAVLAALTDTTGGNPAAG
jgi:Fe-S-cluster containining protein